MLLTWSCLVPVLDERSLRNKFSVKLGIWPNRLDPPSPNVEIFSVNLSEIFGKKGVKYAIKTVIYKS